MGVSLKKPSSWVLVFISNRAHSVLKRHKYSQHVLFDISLTLPLRRPFTSLGHPLMAVIPCTRGVSITAGDRRFGHPGEDVISALQIYIIGEMPGNIHKPTIRKIDPKTWEK